MIEQRPDVKSPHLSWRCSSSSPWSPLGHPQRLELIEQLGQGPRSVDLLAEKLGAPIANVSQHLQAMRRAGLVAAERQGKFMFYRLADASVLAAMQAIQRVAENNLAEVDKIVPGVPIGVRSTPFSRFGPFYGHGLGHALQATLRTRGERTCCVLLSEVRRLEALSIAPTRSTRQRMYVSRQQ